MAAVVTLPPVIYSVADPARPGTFAPFAFFGPYEYSTPARRYMVLLDQTSFRLVVHKSTDGGVTWTAQDSANGPLVESGNNSYMVAQRGNVLSIVYPPAVYSGQRVITFDCTPGQDIFGAPSVDGPSPQGHLAWILQLPSTGDCYVIYRRNTGHQQVLYETFIGGVWGGEVAITAESLNATLLQVLLDPDERIHVFYDIPAATLKTNTVLAGVVGVASTIRAGGSGDHFNEMGQPTIWGTKIVLPYVFDSGGIPLAAVIVGDTYSAPVWDAPLVVDSIPTVTLAGEDEWMFSLVSRDGLTVYVFWVALDYGSFPNPAGIIDQMWYASNDGSGWSAPVLYYDAVANPQQEDPGEDPFSQDIHTISVAALSDGSFGVSTALEENTFCAGYYLLGVGCDITITIRIGSGAPVTVPNNGEPFALPPGVSGVPYGPITFEATEGPTESWEYSVVAGAPPPGIVIGPGTPSNPTPTTDSTDGVPIQGIPTTTTWSGPVTTIWTSKVRLTQ